MATPGSEIKGLIERFVSEKDETEKFKKAEAVCLASTKLHQLGGIDTKILKELEDVMTQKKKDVTEACDRTDALRKFINSMSPDATKTVTGGKPSIRAAMKPPFPYGWELMEAVRCHPDDMNQMKSSLGEKFVEKQAYDVSILAGVYEDMEQERYLTNLETLASKASASADQKYALQAVKILKKEISSPKLQQTFKEQAEQAEARLASTGVKADQVRKFVFDSALRFPQCLGMMNLQLRTKK